MKCCYLKRNKIIPKKNHKTFNHSHDTLSESNHSHDILSELLTCGTCKTKFSLLENKISAICGGCNQFLHCGIAGKCVGPNCGNKVHRLSWCIKCIPKTVIINLQNIGPDKDCLCQECLDDPLTPNCYKKKI